MDILPGFTVPFDIEVKLTLTVTYSTCSADAGEDATISPCKNEPIELMDQLSGTPQVGGVWKAPNGDEVAGTSITTPNLQGQYTYTYRVEEDSSCSDEAFLTIDVQDCDYLSIEDQQLVSISLYPNPTSDILNIEGLTDGSYDISVVDLNGRVIKETKTHASTPFLSLAGVQKGVYFVQIKKSNAVKAIRIVKQ